MATLGDISNITPSSLTSSLFNQLIATQVQAAQAPITTLQSDKSELQTKRAVYTDTQTLLSSLNDLATGLRTSSSSASIFSGKSVSSSDSTVVTATAATGAPSGTYQISVTTLAKAHRVQSDVQANSEQALLLSGTFVVGGAAGRSVSNPGTLADTVLGFDVAGTIGSGQTELGSGSYTVEVRNNGGVSQFRIVDDSGQAVSIAKAGASGSSMTSAWQNLSSVAGTTFDTGRGLTVSFGTGPYAPGSASVTYTAQGASISVSSSDSLADIRDKINAASYADGNGVRASIVNKALVLTAAETGAQHAIVASDGNGGVLQALGVLNGSGAFKTPLQAATDASFTIDGMTVTRDRNTDLDDVIGGISLNLAKEGDDATATVTAQPDVSGISSKISAVLTKANAVLDYLKAKTQTTVSKDSTTGTTTYTRGGLVGETVFQGLRRDIISILRGKMAEATSTSLDDLSDLGIGLDDSLHFAVTDSTKLQAALASDEEGVAALMDDRMKALQDKLEPFIESTSGALNTRIESLENQSARIDSRISAIQKRATTLQEQLLKQYTSILQQVASINADYAESNSIYTESMTATA